MKRFYTTISFLSLSLVGGAYLVFSPETCFTDKNGKEKCGEELCAQVRDECAKMIKNKNMNGTSCKVCKKIKEQGCGIFSTEPVGFSQIEDYKCGIYEAKTKSEWKIEAKKKLGKFKKKCKGEHVEIGINEFLSFFNDYFPSLIENKNYKSSDICKILEGMKE